MKKYIIIINILLLHATGMFPQDKKSISTGGYFTTMPSVMFDTLSGPFINDLLLHNRINMKAYLNDHITFSAEFRNRFFTGDMVKAGKAYPVMIGKDEGIIDMSWNIFNEESFFLNTTIDRLWLDFNYEKFQVRAGRQRINWGQTLVWNPNDIFNAYSFFDIDYTERPGSDAIRLQYYSSNSSAVELAVKADSEKDITAAALYRFSKWGYDIQFLAGYSNSSDIVAGAGWSGSIGSLSFRGEGSWFRPLEYFSDTTGTTIITAGIDKVFGNNSVAQLQLMYCNNPLELENFINLYTGNLSAKDLAFSEFSAFGQFTWAATPLLNLSISAMWFPDLKGYFTGPSVDYSMAENVDFSLIWQHFRGEMAGIVSRMNMVFLRIKYSF
ncbi:MAG: hypothetical protein H6R35_698 [Bacteroidetes bacterium]|nr:hypothetical protein [Bacteroidota bacterium]